MGQQWEKDMKKLTTIALLLILCSGCGKQNKTDKIQKSRNNIVNVKDHVREIQVENVFFHSVSDVYLLDNYLLIADYNSYDMQIHFFNKGTFRHVTSAVPMGQGPGEITRMGDVTMDNTNHRFYIRDAGRNKIFCYQLDSILANPYYMPEIVMEYKEREIPSNYQYINDVLSVGTLIKPTGNSGFRQIGTRFNMKTGEIRPYENLHPEIKKLRISVAASMKYDLYVEAFAHHDLVCIRTLDGDLKYNIYGRGWNTETSNKTAYFTQPSFCRDKIFTVYSGENTFTKNNVGNPVYNWKKQFMIFDLEGNYLKTLDIGYKIVDYCYDEEMNRLYLTLNDDIQFAYLDLDGIVD